MLTYSAFGEIPDDEPAKKVGHVIHRGQIVRRNQREERRQRGHGFPTIAALFVFLVGSSLYVGKDLECMFLDWARGPVQFAMVATPNPMDQPIDMNQ